MVWCFWLSTLIILHILYVIEALRHIRDAFDCHRLAAGQVGSCRCCVAKAMILRWVGVVMPGERTQLMLLARSATDDFDKENEVATNMVDIYPFLIVYTFSLFL